MGDTRRLSQALLKEAFHTTQIMIMIKLLLHRWLHDDRDVPIPTYAKFLGSEHNSNQEEPNNGDHFKMWSFCLSNVRDKLLTGFQLNKIQFEYDHFKRKINFAAPGVESWIHFTTDDTRPYWEAQLDSFQIQIGLKIWQSILQNVPVFRWFKVHPWHSCWWAVN